MILKDFLENQKKATKGAKHNIQKFVEETPLVNGPFLLKDELEEFTSKPDKHL